MFKTNILSISVWVLGGLLLLVALGIIIWRIITRKNISKNPNDKVGSVSKEFNDFIISQASIGDNEILYNILFKNKYSKNKYSLIPAIIFFKNRLFLLTNIISSRKYNEVIFKKELDYPEFSKNNKNFIVNNFLFTWNNEIIKYLNHEFPNTKISVVVPIASQDMMVKNNRDDITTIQILDFEEKLEKLSQKMIPLQTHSKNKIIKKISSINVFKSKISAANKSLRSSRGK